ncbi:hypothetical protein PIB30_082643 [Stylosanthes scabra]|uniref:Uncharacterized protein n=1 Tax=Stylosanthes scabra TaxID=79078 RepID=A0ABU6VQI7_9FABA|nr:hypothetical protein [Stylosanthes scabra]
MPRVKQTGRRNRIDLCALPMLPRLSQMPEEHWFDDANEKLAYDERLSKMEIFPPKFIGDGVLPDKKYPEFWRLIDIQGLRPFLHMRERGFVFCFRLGGRTYEFSLLDLATVWGLKDEGVTFKGGNNPHGTWDEFNKLDAIRGLQLEHVASGKYAISRMSTDHRLLLYMLSYVLLPRKSNHGSASKEDLLILWAMVQEKQIHWPYLMAHRMLSFVVYIISSTCAPTDKADIAEDEGVDVGADAQPQVETGTSSQIPTEIRVPPQFQSDIVEIARKGFEDLRLAMIEGFTRLLGRIDQIDAHLISQDMDIRNLRDEFRSFHGERIYVDFQEQPEDNPMQD